jgi:hypothetical protein
VAYPHQDQLRQVGRGDEDTAPGAAHVGSSSVWRRRYYEDRRALDALIAVVPFEMQFSLSKKRTAKEAWENLIFKSDVGVDDFALRLNT